MDAFWVWERIGSLVCDSRNNCLLHLWSGCAESYQVHIRGTMCFQSFLCCRKTLLAGWHPGQQVLESMCSGSTGVNDGKQHKRVGMDQDSPSLGLSWDYVSELLWAFHATGPLFLTLSCCLSLRHPNYQKHHLKWEGIQKKTIPASITLLGAA